MIEVRVPKFGTSGDTIEVLELSTSEGALVDVGDPLIEAASDKVDFTIESECRGRVLQILCAVGDEVTMGMVVLTIEPEK